MKKGKEKRKKRENYIKNGEKGLKNASFGVINSKHFRGGVFRPPLHNPPTNLFVENYIKNGGKGLKNASFGVINSKNFRGGVFRPPLHPPLPPVGASPRPPQTCSSGKKNDLKKGGGENDRIGQYIPLSFSEGTTSILYNITLQLV